MVRTSHLEMAAALYWACPTASYEQIALNKIARLGLEQQIIGQQSLKRSAYVDSSIQEIVLDLHEAKNSSYLSIDRVFSPPTDS